MTRTALSTASRSTITVMITALIAGCSSMGEEIYTRQNQAASALATMEMEAEAKDPGKADRIYKAELDLHEACAPLREVASRRMTGESVGIDSQVRGAGLARPLRRARRSGRKTSSASTTRPSPTSTWARETSDEIGSDGPADMAVKAPQHDVPVGAEITPGR